MLIRNITLIVIATLFLHGSLSSQEINTTHWGEYQPFQENQKIDSSYSNAAFLRFYNTNFLKNNEYKNDLLKGQSLIGLFIEPSLDFYTGSNTRIRTGVNVLKFHGTDHFSRVRPIISLQHQINPQFSIVFGTLYSAANHGLLEPLLSFESHLTSHYENGIQILLSYPRIKADIWLNWEQFIQAGDPFQEHFTAGSHIMMPIVKTEKWQLDGDLQMLFRHKGGEIDSSDLPAGTQSNITEGIRLKYLPQNSFVESLEANMYYLGFYEINPGDHVSITNGSAQYYKLGLNSHLGNLQLGYWTGNDFFAPHGEPLFMSVSQYKPDFYQKDRKMLTLKYQFSWSLSSYLDLALRLEPYYHFDTQRIDHSWSIYLILDKDFFLRDFNRR